MATLSLTDDLANTLAAAVADGVPIETACQAAGLAPRTLYEWIQAAERGTWNADTPVAPESRAVLLRFLKSMTAAQATWEAKQIAGITRAAEERNEKTGQQDWRARAWLLNNHPRTRHTYHEAKELEVTRQESFHELEAAKALSDDDLKAALELPAPEGGLAGDGVAG